MSISRHAHAFLTAVGLLTRIPVAGETVRPGEDPAPLRDAVAYFPAVGALVGLATGSVIVCASYLWPPAVAVVLGLAFEAVLTGGLHEDAVADFCDAFGGGWTREDILRILKDSRVGSFGALGLGLAVLLRAGATAALPPADLLAATVAAATWGRFVILPIMALVPPVPDRPGSARDFGQGVRAREVGFGLLCALAAMLPFLAGRPWNAAFAFVASGCSWSGSSPTSGAGSAESPATAWAPPVMWDNCSSCSPPACMAGGAVTG